MEGSNMPARSFLGAAILLVALAASNLADAASTYTLGGITTMHSGPGSQYPVIARIRGGRHINVLGCLPDYSWCKAMMNDMRGWISATRLEFPHAGQLVPLATFYTFFNAPTIPDDQRPRHGGSGQTITDCSDPGVLCPEDQQTVGKGPVECEACPWPTGRRPPAP
jgi:uncharacterized protein YraI